MNATLDDKPVEILDRKTLPGDCKSHGVMRFTMVNAVEHAQFNKCFPDPMPETHRLDYHWGVNDRGQRYVEVGPEVYCPAVHDPVVMFPSSPPAPPDPNVALDAERKRLEALSLPDLKTLAVEREVTIDTKWTPAQIVAAVLKGKRP